MKAKKKELLELIERQLYFSQLSEDSLVTIEIPGVQMNITVSRLIRSLNYTPGDTVEITKDGLISLNEIIEYGF